MVQRLREVTITQRLFALAFLALLPAFIVIVYYVLALYQQREREVHTLAAQYGQMASLEMERIISSVESVLLVLSNAPVIRNRDREACEQLLQDVAASLPHLVAFAVADAEGLVHCSAPTIHEPMRMDDRRYYIEAMQADGLMVGPFTRARVGDAASIPIVLPLRDSDGRFDGIIVTGFDLAWLGEQLRTRTLLEGDSITIADRDGVIVAREPFPEQFVGTRIPDEFLNLVEARRPGTIEVASQDGARRILGYYPPAFTGTGLYVSYGVSRDIAFASINAATVQSIAIALAGATGLFLIAWFVGVRLFQRPIARMLATVEAWRLGDETVRTGVPGGQGELAMLAKAIDDYMDQVMADRAARRRAEDHRQLLVRELEHRVKNIFSTVQAIATQSFKNSDELEALGVFKGRLTAMAGAHEMLTTEDWRSAELSHAIKRAIEPFEGHGQSRFSLSGPQLTIPARAALALSMALHELCTNAVKYGALSQDGGHVSIAWRIDGDDDDGLFQLEWREAGGPPVVVSDRKGFGTAMLTRALAAEISAQVSMDFATAGLICTIRCPAGCLVPEEAGAGPSPQRAT